MTATEETAFTSRRSEEYERERVQQIMRGLEEAKAYMKGEREGYKVTMPPTVDVESIRKGLNMIQATFSDSFGGSKPRCSSISALLKIK